MIGICHLFIFSIVLRDRCSSYHYFYYFLLMLLFLCFKVFCQQFERSRTYFFCKKSLKLRVWGKNQQFHLFVPEDFYMKMLFKFYFTYYCYNSYRIYVFNCWSVFRKSHRVQHFLWNFLAVLFSRQIYYWWPLTKQEIGLRLFRIIMLFASVCKWFFLDQFLCF